MPPLKYGPPGHVDEEGVRGAGATPNGAASHEQGADVHGAFS